MLVYHGHDGPVHALAFSPDGSALVSGGRDGRVLLWGDGPSEVPTVWREPQPTYAVVYLPDGRLAVGCDAGWTVERPGDSAARFLQTAGPVLGLGAAGPHLIGVGYGDRAKLGPGAVELWDLKAGRQVGLTSHEPDGVRAVAGCPGKGLFAWATGNKLLKVKDIRRPDVLKLPTTHTATALAFSPDGSLLLAAADWGAKLFDLAKKREVAALKGHKGRVDAVAFSPDGSTAVTGSWDGTVRLWDPATGRQRAGYTWPVGQVTALAYAPDGQRVAAGGDSGAVVVWDAE